MDCTECKNQHMNDGCQCCSCRDDELEQLQAEIRFANTLIKQILSFNHINSMTHKQFQSKVVAAIESYKHPNDDYHLLDTCISCESTKRYFDSMKDVNFELQAENERLKDLNETYNRRLAEQRVRIGDLQAELDKHRWIPVEERLPEKNQRVDLYITITKTDGDYQTITKERFCGYVWNCRSSFPDSHDFTHWKPIILPQALKGDK